MKTQIRTAASIIALTAGLGVLAACGSDDSATSATPGSPASTTSSTPTPSSSPSSSPSASERPDSPEDLTLRPGAAGPIKVGMGKKAVTASGFFETTPAPVEGCDPRLTWIEPFSETFDVLTLPNGEIASIGVNEAGPTTADGLGVGSTLAEVLAAYPDAETQEAGYGQTGVLIADETNGTWIGFLFDPTVGDIVPSDTVSFIELTEGEKPSLIRDGC